MTVVGDVEAAIGSSYHESYQTCTIGVLGSNGKLKMAYLPYCTSHRKFISNPDIIHKDDARDYAQI